jgi:predicted transcriptional regulator
MMSQDLIPLVAEIVSAQASRREMTREELLDTIKLVYSTLANLPAEGSAALENGMDEEPANGAPRIDPAVEIEKSVFPDYIICLEDGKKLKMLKRHLMSAFNMTPENYRTRWNLPANYPMVAPNYAEARSQLAMASGLGRKPGSIKVASAPMKRAKEGASAKRAYRKKNRV